MIVLLLRCQSEWLQGFAAVVFGVGFLAWPRASFNSASGPPTSWRFTDGALDRSGARHWLPGGQRLLNRVPEFVLPPPAPAATLLGLSSGPGSGPGRWGG